MPRKTAPAPTAAPPVTGELPQPPMPKATPKREPKRKPAKSAEGMEKRPRGRRTLMTDALASALEEVFTLGVTDKDACDYVGIDPSTFSKWMTIGRALVEPDETTRGVRLPAGAERERFVQFFKRMKIAKSKMRVAALSTIRLAAQTEWTAAAWLMERSDPTNWARRDRSRVELTGAKDAEPVSVTVRVVDIEEPLPPADVAYSGEADDPD